MSTKSIKPAPVYFIGGGKGGVGKSIVSMALTDHLRRRGVETVLVETDTSNPDVFKPYQHVCHVPMLNLDEHRGWTELSNLLEDYPQFTFVINSAARADNAIAEHGTKLDQAIVALGRKLTTFWVMNRQKDSIMLLKAFMKSVTNGDLHVVLNEYHGTSAKFFQWNKSEERGIVEAAGGKTLVFPELGDLVCDVLNDSRCPFEIAIGKKPPVPIDDAKWDAKAEKVGRIPIGNRIEIETWLSRCDAMFREVIE